VFRLTGMNGSAPIYAVQKSPNARDDRDTPCERMRRWLMFAGTFSNFIAQVGNRILS